MGIERIHRTARVAPEVAAYIDDFRMARWPVLSRSSAINLIVNEHRLLFMAGILGPAPFEGQRGHCPQNSAIAAAEPKRLTGAARRREVQLFA